MKQFIRVRGYRDFFVFGISFMIFIFYIFSVPYLFALHTIIDEVGNPKTACEPTCLELNNILAEQKKLDDSKAISNLTNSIYYLTLLIMLFTVAVPFILYIQQNKRADDMKNLVAEKVNTMKETLAAIQKEHENMEYKIRNEIQDKFHDEVIDILTKKLNQHMKYHNEIMQLKINQQTAKHEDSLYYAERVHLDLLTEGRPKEGTLDSVVEWVVKQQEDHVTLLELISPKEKETFSALGIFEQRDDLPQSFLTLLRFLHEQDRLPGDSAIKAMRIAQEKFEESLDEPTEESNKI